MNTKPQLAREIVAFIQNNGGETRRCINFVEYEFDLRMIAKHELREYIDKLLKECHDAEAKIYLKDIKTIFCSEIEPLPTKMNTTFFKNMIKESSDVEIMKLLTEYKEGKYEVTL